MLLAKDIMRKKVITIERFQTIQELAQLLQDRSITGVPVVDEDGLVLGVVSQTDLVRVRREASSGVPAYHLEPDMPTSAVGMHLEDMENTRVESIMTPGAIAFDENTPIEKLARAMTDLHIHRILITRSDKLCGIVTSLDMVKALLPVKAVKIKKSPRRHGRR